MTPQQIEAMNLALEALEWSKPHDDSVITHNEAIAALKEALAEHAIQEVQRFGQEIEQEPVYHLRQYGDVTKEQLDRYIETGDINPPAQPQRTEQEPVKLPCCGYADASAVKWNPFNGVVQCHNCGQTYTPPQRKPLTDDLLTDLWYKQSLDWMEFARAIEAAHGIKENT
jgi:hypothetical protein